MVSIGYPEETTALALEERSKLIKSLRTQKEFDIIAGTIGEVLGEAWQRLQR